MPAACVAHILPTMSTPAALPEAPAEAAPADPSKAIIQRILDEAPNGLELMELASRIELIAGVRLSQRQATRGETIPFEELERDMKTWFTK